MKDAIQWTIADGMKDAIKMPSVLPSYNFDDEPQEDSCQSQIYYYFTELTEEMVSALRADQIVTEAGFREQSNKLTALGLLQFALLTTEPFNFKGTLDRLRDKIQDVRNDLKYGCQDRVKLLESLAKALLSSQDHYPRASTLAYWLKNLQDHTVELNQVLKTYFDLREQGIVVPTSGVKGMHRSAVERACEVMAKVMDAITLEDYREIVRYSYCTHPFTDNVIKSDDDRKLELLKEMERCFEDYGPRKSSKDATYHAMAAILLTFEIEAGDRLKVADRIRKRLARALD
jgi:hypothetical protein